MTKNVFVTYSDGSKKIFPCADFDAQRFIDFIITQPGVVAAK